MENKHKANILLQKYLPILIILFYLNLTIILFAYGPYNYPLNSPILFYIFLFTSNFILFVGYLIGVEKSKLNINNQNESKEKQKKNIMKYSFVFFITFIPLTNYLNTGSILFNTSAFNDLGAAYIDSLNIRDQRSGSVIISYLRIFLSFYLICFIPLGLFMWNTFSIKLKTLFVLGVLGGLSLDLFRGTNKSLADYLIIFLVFFLFKIVISSLEKKESKLNPLKYQNPSATLIIKLIFIVTFLFFGSLVFYFYFSNTAPERYGVSLFGPNGQYSLNLDNVFLSIIPTFEGKLALSSLIHYFTQGYYALGLSIDKPFMPTFGLGGSMAILINSSQLFNTNLIFENSYVYRNSIENGWDWMMQWSSFYVWIASDISFFGVLILLGVIGYFLGATWMKSIFENDYLSYILFTQLFILCIYLPANNQLFQSYEGLVGNLLLFIFWIINKKRGDNI